MAVSTQTKQWTLDELHRLPDDGNKYELVHGELLVTPPPSYQHETIAARLNAVLTPFVVRHGLGEIHRPRAVMRHHGSQVEPDLMARAKHPSVKGNDRDWNTAPVPILVIEILSPFTRRRDRTVKRQLYLEAGVAEYWIVDPEERTVMISRPDGPDAVTRERIEWRPPGAPESLIIDVREMTAP